MSNDAPSGEASGPRRRRRPAFPRALRAGRALAAYTHDVMSEICHSGHEHNIFSHCIDLDDGERARFDEAEDVWEWLEATNRVADTEQILARMVTPALLADSLHFVYEAIDCAASHKTTVAFALLRKPFVDNLFLLEQLLLDPGVFCAKLKADPLSLRLKTLSSPEARRGHVEAVVAKLGAPGKFFDAQFITSLRFEKGSEDSFEPLWNKALHIVTEHHAIRTEKMDLNFVFSDRDAILSQQSYFFARVPYLLAYFREVAEALVARYALTPGEYLELIDSRFAAGVVLWGRTLDVTYRSDPILRFVDGWGHVLLQAGETSRPSDARLRELFHGSLRPGDESDAEPASGTVR